MDAIFVDRLPPTNTKPSRWRVKWGDKTDLFSTTLYDTPEEVLQAALVAWDNKGIYTTYKGSTQTGSVYVVVYRTALSS